ncbi:MAG TPA: hypothetical protein DDZ81_16875 [Acetobacteraceae bacterium]|nr:hypothetical protein [Acetobacteraceae bacterium]
MTERLAALSQSVSRIAAGAGSWLSAIRVGPNRHVTGLVCEGGLVVTCDQALPALERYSVVSPNGTLVAAHAGSRDPGSNLAVLHLETPWPVANPEIADSLVGGLVIVVGADADASPTVRLTVVHRLVRTADGHAPVLDMSGDRIDHGSLVIDEGGRLIGLATLGPNGEAMAIPSSVIGRMLMPGRTGAPVRPAAPLAPSAMSSRRRAWLGVALQPITIPDGLATRAGQGSGRMVVSLTRGGPAEMAGLRVGDVLLALNGTSASGPQALRAFLSPERIGSTIEIKLLRDGNVVTSHLTVAVQPD